MSRKAPSPISLFDCDKPKYDYPGIDDPIVRADLEQRTTAIRRRMQDAAQCILDIGRDLQHVHDHLKHGEYLEWLQAEFKMSQSMAYNFRNAWKRFGQRDIKLGNLRCAVIYLLAAPSTPQAAVEDVLEKDRQGEQVTVAEAKDAINRHRQPARSNFQKLENSQELAVETGPSSPTNTAEAAEDEEKGETPPQTQDERRLQ